MTKTHWLGVVAMSLMSAAALSGCSGDDVPPVGMAGAPPATAGTGTTGGSGGGATGGAPATGGVMGMQLMPPAYYTVLTGANAAPNPMPAPAAYKSIGCNSCHGENGEGNVIGPEIRFTPPEYSKAVIRGGRKNPDEKMTMSPMGSFPVVAVPPMTVSLADADLDAMIAWLNAAPKPTTPDGLYKAMCGNCHGPKMATGGSAPVGIMGKSKAQVAKLVREGSGTDYNDRKKYMPKYDTTLLSETELASIQTYLGSL